MIISHAHKFIFLRTAKTASKSLTHALAARALPEDEVITPFLGKWAQSLHLRSGALKLTFPHLLGLHTHAKAKQVRSVLGKKIFDSYFKFAVERNPWERQVSLYFHRAKREKYNNPDFDRDMRSRLYRQLYLTRLHNWDIYSIDGSVVADQVINYRDIHSELPKLLEKLGLEGGISLPRLNSDSTIQRPHYSTFYSEPVKSLITQWYQREIDEFGFKFETTADLGDASKKPTKKPVKKPAKGKAG